MKSVHAVRVFLQLRDYFSDHFSVRKNFKEICLQQMKFSTQQINSVRLFSEPFENKL